MSFRWPVGDIGPLICLAIKIIDALDSGGGATKTLPSGYSLPPEPHENPRALPVASSSRSIPACQEEICEHVDKIKLAISPFLRLAERFEPDLGGTELIGCHQHIFPKLKWRFIASKALTNLMMELSGHMRVLDTLMFRITVYVQVFNTPFLNVRFMNLHNICREMGNKLSDQIQTIELTGEEQQTVIIGSIQDNF
jgi:hypothetical protein